MPKKYYIKCYIPVDVDPEEETYYDSFDELTAEVDNLGEMFPENIYIIEERD